MPAIIRRFARLAANYNGLTYDLLFILYSWFYGLLFRRLVLSESSTRFFEKGDAGMNLGLFALLAAAALAEIAGGYLIARRMRHIKTHPAEYPGMVSSGSGYTPGDGIFFLQIWLAGCRLAPRT